MNSKALARPASIRKPAGKWLRKDKYLLQAGTAAEERRQAEREAEREEACAANRRKAQQLLEAGKPIPASLRGYL